MKKFFFITVIVMTAFPLCGQSFEKGNLIGVHVTNLKLKSGVTEEKATAFFMEKLIPAWEKNFGTKVFLMRGVRGKYAGMYAIINEFKNEKHRDQFWSNTGEATEAYNLVNEALMELNTDADKLWYPMETTYNDYLISVGKGEEIKKGVLIGLHNESLKLNKGFTEQQYLDYFTNNVLPAMESYMPAIHVNMSMSIRGSDSSKIGTFYFFPDESIRALFFDKDDNETQYLKDYETKYQDIYDGWSKIGTTEDTYTDWLIL